MCCLKTRKCPQVREYVLIAMHFLLEYWSSSFLHSCPFISCNTQVPLCIIKTRIIIISFMTFYSSAVGPYLFPNSASGIHIPKMLLYTKFSLILIRNYLPKDPVLIRDNPNYNLRNSNNFETLMRRTELSLQILFRRTFL